MVRIPCGSGAFSSRDELFSEPEVLAAPVAMLLPRPECLRGVFLHTLQFLVASGDRDAGEIPLMRSKPRWSLARFTCKGDVFLRKTDNFAPDNQHRNDACQATGPALHGQAL